MNRQSQHTYSGGMVQDLSKSKSPNTVFYSAKNIRLNATTDSSSASITNEKGNLLKLTVPTPVINFTTKVITYGSKTLNYSNSEINSQLSSKLSGQQVIIAISEIRDHFILYTTDSNGYDCIWKVHDTTFDVTLLYLRDMKFSNTKPIQAINNYENKSIDKLYWVDSKNQLRFINTAQSIVNGDSSELIDLNVKLIDSVSAYNISQPKVNSIRFGGIHTAGVIQYAYNLYTVNGSQTKLSPLSELVSLNKGLDGGGAVNSVVGTIPIITIDNLDTTFTNIRIYAIKYTSLNQTPEVSLIADRSIIGTTSITYPDDGNVIENMSIEEITFLGSNVIIPKHISTKDNILFSANYDEKNFNVKNLDTRAYSLNGNTGVIGDNITVDINGNISFNNQITINITNPTTLNVPENHSTINTSYSLYKFNDQGVFGGIGKNIRYSITRSQVGVNGFSETTRRKGGFFKDGELYRLAIQFYNKYGQISLPKWIADFIVNSSSSVHNLNGYYAGISIDFQSNFYVWLNTQSNFLNEDGVYDEFLKPIGYRLLRADRTDLDKTILMQGIINPMMANKFIPSGDYGSSNSEFARTAVKMPSMMRRFDDKLSPMLKCENYRSLQDSNTVSNSDVKAGKEVFLSVDSDYRDAKTVQYNQLMTMYSPEIEFDKVNTNSLSGYKLNIAGGLTNKYNNYWGQLRNADTRVIDSEMKVNNRISYYAYNTVTGLDDKIVTTQGGNAEALSAVGIFAGPSGSPSINDNYMQFHQFYRKYDGTFYKSTNSNLYNFYGVPELATKGQGITRYYNDPELNYTLTLETFAGGNVKRSSSSDPDDGHQIRRVNTHNIKSLVFVESSKKPIETIKTECVSDDGVGLIAELKLDYNAYYLNNLYKGNSYEAKKTTDYIEIGEYKDIIGNSSYNCVNPGDMFVSNYKFVKFVKTDVEIYSRDTIQITEIVDVILETTVDVDHRHDESVKAWDLRFQPRYDEYASYNNVYSQQSTFLSRRDFNYNYKAVNKFDVAVIPSKVKIPGELIDSFTDIQTNSVLYLDGKYGPINNLVNFNDQIYTLQDNGLAYLSINPRVQVQGSDGIAVELGSGQVLPEYKYISTESGTVNKWSTIVTPSGFYYFDLLNNSLNRFRGQLEGLSDIKGNHIYFQNNIVRDQLKIDNPIIKQGISAGYDYINNDMYMAFHQGENSFNIRFNEASDLFMGNKDYIPSFMKAKNNNFITTDPTNNKLYLQFAGDYNKFYEQYYPTSITLLLNPEANMDTIFNNISFKSEVYLNNVDQYNNTVTHIRLYNEYQDSGRIPLIPGRNSNIRRLFRNWNIQLPRNNGTRQRIRNSWTYLTLEFENTNNLKLILHDLILSYSV